MRTIETALLVSSAQPSFGNTGRWNFTPWVERFLEALHAWSMDDLDVLRRLVNVPCGVSLFHFKRLGNDGHVTVQFNLSSSLDAKLTDWTQAYIAEDPPKIPMYLVVDKACSAAYSCAVCSERERQNGTVAPWLRRSAFFALGG